MVEMGELKSLALVHPCVWRCAELQYIWPQRTASSMGLCRSMHGLMSWLMSHASEVAWKIWTSCLLVSSDANRICDYPHHFPRSSAA